MYRRHLLLSALVLALLTTALTAAEPPGLDGWILAFEDDFERPAIGMTWLIMRGDWRIENGRLKITRAWTSDSCIRTVAPMRGNVRLEFDVMAPGPHFVKAAVRIGDQFWDGGGRARAGRGARIGGNLGEVVLAPSDPKRRTRTDADIEANHWHHVVIQYEDGRHRAWLDGKAIKDEKITFGGRFNDYVALFAIKDAEWDNVRIYTKPYARGFRPDPAATPETNRRATVDAGKFLDPTKPDCGFQEAIDSLPLTGGAVILPKGRFVLHTTLFLREGVALRGRGRDTILALSSPIVWSKVAAPARRGDTAVTVEDASRLEAGWMLNLGGDPMYYLRGQEPFRAVRVEGNTIHLNRPLGRALRKGAPVGNWFPMVYAANDADIEVRDLVIDGRAGDPAPFNGSFGASAVTFMFVRNVRVDNVHVNGWKGDAFSFQGGRDNLCTNCTVIGATGHGYHPGSCQRRTIIADSKAERCGRDGYYFCRYNQQSVIWGNTFNANKGAMIGGLAKAGDHYNAIVRNQGTGNGLGVPFNQGANDVFVDNLVLDSGGDTLLMLAGGKYEGRPHSYHPYAGPSRYHVIVGNTFHTRSPEARIAADEPGAAANIVAANACVLRNPVEQAFAVNGPESIVEANRAVAHAETPEIGGSAPPLPRPVLDASPWYDPDAPDCGFQKAIDALAKKGGGTVRLPAGLYRMEKGLRLPSNLTLCGEGVATVLLWHGPGWAISADRTADTAVRRLTIRDPEPDPPHGDTAAIVLVNPRGALIEGVAVEAAYDGISAGGRDVTIVGCRMRGCRVGYSLRRSLRASLSCSHGLECIEGLRLGAAKDAVVTGNIFWFQRRHGIYGQDFGLAHIVGNVISCSGEEGIRVDATGVIVRGNVIHNSSLRRRGAHAGILLQGKTTGCRIVANRIGDDLYDPFQTTAVRETEGCDDNLIQYNVCCPENRPRTGALDNVIVTVGGKTVARGNVLAPYPPPKP